VAAPGGHGGVLERAHARILIGAAALLGLAGAAALWQARRDRAGGAALPIPGENVSLTVEVLNATTVDGLAREVTRLLRRRGIDVVSFGTAATHDLDSTRIVVRRGDSGAVRRVRDALGTGRITVELDGRLLLDASVLVGRDLAPAGEGDP